MTAALLDHLWQSTLFALFAWFTTLLLRRNGAHLRHGVWLCASVKFLVPFSLLAMLGAQLKPWFSPEQTHALAALATADVSALLVSPGRAISATSASGYWLNVAMGIWMLGTLALAARWLARWRRVRALLRAATSSDITALLSARTSPDLREPGVAGILKPVLLLPAHIEDHLTPAQLDAIVKHELCHVHRRDNLTASIHMLVEALFWFHPLVWWIGARLIEERERACDEAVVRAGNDPKTYAEGILTVCRTYVASDLACMSGVSGADLKTRLEGIMKTQDLIELNGIRKFALGVVAASAIAAPLVLGLALPAQAEAPAAQQATNHVGKITLLPGKRVRLNYKNVDVRELLRAMGEAAQVNVLANTSITGNVTLDLAETTWDQAMKIILNANGLVSYEKDGVLFIDVAKAGQASAT
jgi:beta-lactamase regulating signal transducer with metallopeptidase domain